MIIKTEADKERAINQIKVINIEKVWQVDIKPYKPNRSAAQNRIMWKWLGIIGDDIGYHQDEMHVVFRDKFLGYDEVECMGVLIQVLRSTADLKVKPFAEYLTRIEMFAGSELGIRLPNSDDLYYEAMGIKR